MEAEGLLQAVRRELSLGRLAPLGTAADGAWVAERAAVPVLRAAVHAGVRGVRLDGVRLAVADPAAAGPPAVPPPPGALPPGPVLVRARCAVAPGRPLPERAAEVRHALASAARERLGLDLAGVDVTIADLLDGPPGAQADVPEEREAGAGARVGQAASAAPGMGPEGAVAAAVLAVPGVLGLAPAHGGRGAAVSATETSSGPLLRLGLVVDGSRRTLDVARAIRAAAAGAVPEPATGAATRVSLLITDVLGPPPA
ncbi:nucleopolyhedrovirus P10 family protein [Streptomyces hoynatensis]|uniref:Nucleopolyhedrovirus P10 family protein n=1 Tax=Streptomyces hoynatensis TaxID=1141874 RepID=A0A3A9Z3R5_9ACTN|nr:nucleopolyhedrovirus P10 family protein [Streptomyces hoynatensis]RKN42454.1 nucleopolyhedrovirus P10 family protein [Streptomyces hoynatensis]